MIKHTLQEIKSARNLYSSGYKLVEIEKTTGYSSFQRGIK